MPTLALIAAWCGFAALLLSTAYWLFAFFAAFRIFARVQVVSELLPRSQARWPKVALIIPACNEEAAIEEAVQSKLADGYPNLEVVLVNDRSTDRTGEIAERLASGDPRIRVIHVRELPEGWLGKVNAMQRGVEATDGEWVLLSDADVHLAPGTLQRIVGAAEERGLELAACLPDLWPTTFLLDVALCTFIRFFCIAARLWGVDNPKSTACCGVGAFNLVRRTALARIGGLEQLKLTVVDDVALGQLLKRDGARCAAFNGRGCVGLHFYRTLGEMARGTEKNVPALGYFNLGRLLWRTVVFLIVETTPFVAVWLTTGWMQAATAAVIGLALATQLLFCRWMRRPLVPALFSPIGALIFAVVVVRAGVLEAWRGGIMWRGTLYPTAQLKSEQRFEFM